MIQLIREPTVNDMIEEEAIRRRIAEGRYKGRHRRQPDRYLVLIISAFVAVLLLAVIATWARPHSARAVEHSTRDDDANALAVNSRSVAVTVTVANVIADVQRRAVAAAWTAAHPSAADPASPVADAAGQPDPDSQPVAIVCPGEPAGADAIGDAAVSIAH